MDQRLTPEHVAIRDAARKLLRVELAPHAVSIDRGERTPFELVPLLVEHGFFGPAIPEAYGGQGMDLTTEALLSTELARICPSTALSVGASTLLFAGTILASGTEAQKKRYVTPVARGERIGCWGLTEPHAGSDIASIRASAMRDGRGWVLNGTKTFITNAPVADLFVVYARTGEGDGRQAMSAFIIEKGTPGLSVGTPFKKMGFRGSPTGEIFMDDVRVPEESLLGTENMGFFEALPTLTSERVLMPFLALGMMERCLELSIAYAREREAFGKPIAHKQAVQFKIAHMYTLTEHVRAMAWSVLEMKEQGIEHVKQASAAKCFAGEAALEVAMDAVQIHAGYGYVEEYEVERFARDAKLLQIGGGTTEIQRLLIGRLLLQ